MFKSLLAPIAILLAAQPVSAQSQQADPDLVSFHALYRELIETNTTLSSGSCTAAADKVQVRLDAFPRGRPEWRSRRERAHARSIAQ